VKEYKNILPKTILFEEAKLAHPNCPKTILFKIIFNTPSHTSE